MWVNVSFSGGAVRNTDYTAPTQVFIPLGLWKLNQNGTRQLDAQSQPIPTYDNGDITEMARVFTGMTFAECHQCIRYQWPSRC